MLRRPAKDSSGDAADRAGSLWTGYTSQVCEDTASCSGPLDLLGELGQARRIDRRFPQASKGFVTAATAGSRRKSLIGVASPRCFPGPVVPRCRKLYVGLVVVKARAAPRWPAASLDNSHDRRFSASSEEQRKGGQAVQIGLSWKTGA